jgi:hypothetical protein
MLTEVKAYSSWEGAPTLLLDENGSAETDLIQVREITGLDPIKATINVSPFGSVDGSAYVGSDVISRNIVLTLRPNPNWANWTYEALRRLIYQYFMPKQPTRLVFESDDIPPVEISGVVESVESNMFSVDPEILVSVICPDPYFTALDPMSVFGTVVPPGDPGELAPIIFYEGSVETGVYIQVSHNLGALPTKIGIQVGDPIVSDLQVAAGVSANLYFEMSSVPLSKYIQNVDLSTGAIINLLSKTTVAEGSKWPVLQPGPNRVIVSADGGGTNDFEIRYYEKFGGL